MKAPADLSAFVTEKLVQLHRQGRAKIPATPHQPPANVSQGATAAQKPQGAGAIPGAPLTMEGLEGNLEAAMTPAKKREVLADLESALAHKALDGTPSHDPRDRDTWIANGHRLKSLGEAGYELWRRWSRGELHQERRD